MLTTIDNCKIDFSSGNKNLLDSFKKKYQPKSTASLDNHTENFKQETINEIVLWKVNRYAEIPESTLSKINKINKNSTELDITLTKEIISELLKTTNKGFGLPMISTILRFKNPEVYQIIDQRVYRFIYGKNLKLKNTSIQNEIDIQVELYLTYLDHLRKKCKEHNIPFRDADRILYLIDKNENKKIPLDKYGIRKEPSE